MGSLLNFLELTNTQNLLRCPQEVLDEAVAENKLVAFDMKETVVMDTTNGEVKAVMRRPWNFRAVDRETLDGA